jgi:hypothetical protein
MNIYSIIALFLHIVGALGVSVALGLEWIGLRHVQSALLPEQVRTWIGILKGTNKVGFPCMLTTVITGIYMVLKGWGWVPWILITLGALVLVIVLSVALSKPRMAAIGKALATEKGTISPTLRNLVKHPILWISIQTRVTIVLGIIFLKIVKPDLAGSLLTIGVAVALGVASALPMLRPVQGYEAPAH